MIVNVFQAKLKDLDDIAKLEQESFAYPWSKDALMREIMSTGSFVVIAKSEEEILGYAMFMLMYDEIHITKIAVKNEYRRKDIGNLMLNALLNTAFSNNYFDITLEVRVSNKGAIALYEKNGFESAGVRKHYYTDNNEDALIMWLHMKEGDKNE